MVKSTTKTPSKKKNTSVKKTTIKPKASPKKVTTKAPVVSQKVDYYPNRMTVAVSVLAGTLLVLITLITVLGSR